MKTISQKKSIYKIRNNFEWTIVKGLIDKGYTPGEAVMIALGTGFRPGLQVESHK